MSDVKSLARPYAKGAFAVAQSHQQLATWSQWLQVLALLLENKAMRRFLQDPAQTPEARMQALLTIASHWFRPVLTEPQKNFIHLLFQQKRVDVLPAIAELFETYRAQAEASVTAEVISAFPLTSAQEKSIIQALERRLQRTVSLQTKTQRDLIGGIVIQIGSTVIDGSIQGRLQQLANQLA